MGDYISKPTTLIVTDGLLKEFKSTQLYNIQEAITVYHDLYQTCSTLDFCQFDLVFGHIVTDVRPHFELWCQNNKTESQGACIYETICGWILFSRGRLDVKISTIFRFFDFDDSGFLSIHELTILYVSAIKGLCTIAGISHGVTDATIGNLYEFSHKLYDEIDADKGGTISLGEFINWAQKSEALQEYILHFLEGPDIEDCIRKFENKKRTFKLKFDSMERNRHVSLEDLIHQNEFLVATNEEKIFFQKSFSEHLDFDSFTCILSSLVSFQVADYNNDGSLQHTELKALIWMIEGHEPSCERVLLDKSKIDLDGDGNIGRKEWISYCVISRDIFNAKMKAKFDKHDVDDSCELDMDEFHNFIKSVMADTVPTTELDTLAMMEKLSIGVTEELVAIMEIKTKTIPWLEICRNMTKIAIRLAEFESWLNVYGSVPLDCVHIGKNNELEICAKRLPILLTCNLKFLLDSSLVTEEEVQHLAQTYSKKIQAKFPKIVAAGFDTLNDIKKLISKATQSMMNKAQKIAKKRIKMQRRYTTEMIQNDGFGKI